MALRDQPYLPLYVQDILTDEKLIECSAEAHGVYLRILCILHKQETYGMLCLKQKHKQSESKIINFALMLSKQMPFSEEIIRKSLIELFEEKVIYIEEDALYQKRMMKDGEISLIRKEVGKIGGSNVTKQYGKPGFIYLMSDGESKHKIGLSVNPQNRLYKLRSTYKLKKYFILIDTVPVKDMGLSEDFAQDFYGDKMDGEWLNISFTETKEMFSLLKAKLKANNKAKPKPNAEYEYESDNDSINPKRINKKAPPKILFSDCEFYELPKFISAYSGTDYENYNLPYYYECVKSWSAEGNKKADWIATARNFMLRDFKENKAVFKNGTGQTNNNRSGQANRLSPTEAYAADLARRIQEHGDNGNNGSS